MTSSSPHPLLDTPQFLTMVRSKSHDITEKDAISYVHSLTNKKASNGCYVVKCMKPCTFPIACTYNMTCCQGWCMNPGCSTIPFGCFICLNGSDESGYYVNMKGDTVVVKVDDENDTLACFGHTSQRNGTVCCYCNKL